MGLLKRVANKNGDSFVVKTDEGVFKMLLDEDFNLVFCNASPLNNGFNVKVDDEVFLFIDNLYDSIINCAPYINFPKDFPNRDKVFPNDLLVFDDKIIYNSDDSNGNSLIISKKTEEYVISFDKADSLLDKTNVVISGSFSNYMPYNFTFINMYERMKNYWSNRGYTFSKGKSRVRK